MLNILRSGRSDHPLADPQLAAELLSGLPSDPLKALEELTGMIDSVSAAPLRADERAEALLLVDAAAQRFVRRATRDYMSSREDNAQQARLWFMLRDFCKQDAAAFTSLINQYLTGARGAGALKSLLPVISVRALRSLGALLKWLAVRYGPYDEPIWKNAGAIYALAEKNKYATQSVTPYAKIPGDTTVEREFIRLLLLWIASPATMLPLEIESAEHISAQLCGSLSMSVQRSGTTYWVDLLGDAPPARRTNNLPQSAAIRFLSPAPAAEKAESLLGELTVEQAIPESVQIPDWCPLPVVATTLAHLAAHWSAQPPTRRHTRTPSEQHFSVAHGHEGVCAALTGEQRIDTGLDFSARDPIEHWVTRNISLGGFGAVIARPDEGWLRVRSLLGVQMDGASSWQLAVIRGMERLRSGEVFAEVEMLSHRPTVARVFLIADGQMNEHAESAILLAPPGSGEAQIVLKTGVRGFGQSFLLEHGDKRFLLDPQGASQIGDDFEIVTCQTRSVA